MEYLCRNTATQSMKYKIGNEPCILPSLLNQRLILLIHQPDGFVAKLICIFIFIEYTKSQRYRKYKLTLQLVNILVTYSTLIKY